jgi:TadE-like protein
MTNGNKRPMKPRNDPRTRTRRGQAMVESALVFLATLLIIIGIMDFGQVLMTIQMSNERARAGARWASTHTADVQKIKNYVAYGTETAPAGQGDDGPPSGIFGIRPEHITVQRQNAGTPNDTIRISVRKPMTFLSPYIAGSFNPKPAVASSPVESLGATE